jgi:ribosome maturation factor RimP
MKDEEWGCPLFIICEEDIMTAGKGNTAAIVWQLAAPVAQGLGLRLWDVRFAKEGAAWYLRVFVDKDGGVGLDDCEAMSRALDAPLEETDPIPQSYHLEVCSPGLERELTRSAHFKAYLGQKVLVRLIRPMEGQRDFFGVLDGFDGERVTLRRPDGSGFSFLKKEAAFVKLDDFGD